MIPFHGIHRWRSEPLLEAVHKYGQPLLSIADYFLYKHIRFNTDSYILFPKIPTSEQYSLKMARPSQQTPRNAKDGIGFLCVVQKQTRGTKKDGIGFLCVVMRR